MGKSRGISCCSTHIKCRRCHLMYVYMYIYCYMYTKALWRSTIRERIYTTGKQFHTPCRPMYKPSLYICASLTLRKSSKEPRELSFLSLCRSLMREEVLEASRHCFFPPPQGLPTLPSLMVCGQYTKWDDGAGRHEGVWQGLPWSISS